MKSIIIIKETKKLYKLTDYSYLRDENFVEISGMKIFSGTKYENYFEFTEIEKGLKIPVKELDLNRTIYLDCSFVYQGKKFFTMERFLKEKEFITEEKKLFIPDFGKESKAICDIVNNGCLFEKGFNNCSQCICNEENFKYLR